MGCGQCIEGKTEKETLELSLRWLAGWSQSLAKDVMSISHALKRIGTSNSLHFDGGKMTNEELCAIIGSKNALIHGLAQCLRESYSDEDGSILPNLIRGFEDIADKCAGEKPFGTTWISSWEQEKIRKIIGDEEKPVYDIIRIDGNENFMRRQHHKETLLDYIVKIVEEERREDKKVALLFESSDALEYLRKYCNGILIEIDKRFGGDVKFFYPSSEFEEMLLERMEIEEISESLANEIKKNREE